jgi:hypothetical protein
MAQDNACLQLQQLRERRERMWNRSSEVIVLQITAPTSNKNIRSKITWTQSGKQALKHTSQLVPSGYRSRWELALAVPLKKSFCSNTTSTYQVSWMSNLSCINGSKKPNKNPGNHCHDSTGTYSLTTTRLPSFNWQENPSHADGEQGSSPFHDLSISFPGFLPNSSSFSCFATSTAEQGQQKSPHGVRNTGIEFESEHKKR